MNLIYKYIVQKHSHAKKNKTETIYLLLKVRKSIQNDKLKELKKQTNNNNQIKSNHIKKIVNNQKKNSKKKYMDNACEGLTH